MDEMTDYTTVEAIVLTVETKTGTRYFSKAIKDGKIMTAYTLAGAQMFGPWREDVIQNVEKMISKGGYKFSRKRVGFINHPENW